MDAISAYSFASSGWNALQGIPLVIGPQAIISLIIDQHPRAAGAVVAGDVENYLARSLGLTLLALGLVTVVATGSVPVGSAADANREAPTPHALSIILITTLVHGTGAFYNWARYTATGRTGYFLGFVGSALLAAFGVWCVLFGGEKGRISRRTGADKRTSGFPFRNAEADRRKAM
ncbi:hypothetical protein F4802DRAFT_564700 [Xylaria palmicola]|nr:hypothetical protein F4802DRAFT_564700 [Xylaria palmicola]